MMHYTCPEPMRHMRERTSTRERVDLLRIVSLCLSAFVCFMSYSRSPSVFFFVFRLALFYRCACFFVLFFAVSFVPGTLTFHLLSVHMQLFIFGFSVSQSDHIICLS